MPQWIIKAWRLAKSFSWNAVLAAALCLPVFTGGTAVASYTTPGTGETLTLAQLAATSGSFVSGADGSYALAQSLNIAAGDTLTLAPGDTLTMTAGADVKISVEGTLRALGTESSHIVLTGSGDAAGDWKSVYVTKTGRVELSFCDISESSNGVFFDEVTDPTSASSIVSCTIEKVAWDGIKIKDMAAELTIQGSTIQGAGESGITLRDRADQVVITGNTLADNTHYGVKVFYGAWNMEISNNTVSGNALGGILINVEDSAGDNLRITGNTFTGNLGSAISANYVAGLLIRGNTITDHTGLTGISLDHAWNSLVELNTISGCATGVDMKNGIPGKKAQSAPYAWVEVNRNNADTWDEGEDDAVLPEAAIGFDFPLNGQTYTHFQTQTNGSVELVTASGLSDGIDDYNGWAFLVKDSPTRSFLFALSSDFRDEGANVTEQHNGVDVVMNGWGYKHFSAGDVDGDGNTVAEECTVFRWVMQFYNDDEATGPYNDFQVVIFPDGRVRWSVRAIRGSLPSYSQLLGLYAGTGGAPVFVNAASGVREQATYLFNPATAGDASTGLFSNTISDCETDAIVLTDVTASRLKWNALKSNPSGLKLDGASSSNTIASNLFVENTVSLTNNMATPVDATSNFWASEEISEGNYTVLDTADLVDAVIADDDEDETKGAVTFEPFLTEAPVRPVTTDDESDAGSDSDSDSNSGSGSGCFINSLTF